MAFSKFLHPLKAYASIFLNEFGNSTLVIPLHPLKANWSICSIESSKVKLPVAIEPTTFEHDGSIFELGLRTTEVEIKTFASPTFEAKANSELSTLTSLMLHPLKARLPINVTL